MHYMSKHFEPEFKKRLVVFILKMEEPSEHLLLNLMFQKRVFQTGLTSTVKNTKQMSSHPNLRLKLILSIMVGTFISKMFVPMLLHPKHCNIAYV